jgi:RHS repeat-associated protein
MTIDGSPASLSNNTTNPGTPGANFTIGALSDGTRPFVGEIDEVSAYTADISGATAAAHLAAGRRPSTDTTTALTTRNAYDRLGRLTDAWAPDLVRTKATYDRLGNQTETIANYRDGLTTGGTAADDVRSTFAYDVLGELIGYCPAEEVMAGDCTPSDSNEAQAWHYAFDAMGRQILTIPPVNTTAVALTTEQVVYEPGGRIEKTCRYPALVLPSVGACGDPASRQVKFTYDDLGRILTQETWDRGPSDPESLEFTKSLTWNADGSPATVAEGSDTLTYAYDTAGRVSQFKRGSTVLTSYTYTAATSTIATRTDGTQGATAFTHDWARRQTVIDPPDAFVTGTVTRTYRLDGTLATQAFPSAITETLAYDAVKRPTSISLGSAGSISQAFDRAGRVTSDSRSLAGISGDAGTGSQSFAYDALSRLAGSSGLALTRSYQYDLDGNRTRKVEAGVTTDYQYDRTDQVVNQVIGGTTRTFDYDRYGNLLTSADAASAVTTYAYDEASRLTTISPPGGATAQVTFTVDPLDRHATRLVNAGLTDTYQYLDASETAWQTGTGTTTSALLDADGSRLAVKTGSTVSWLVFDLHGSVAALCSTSGTLTDAYRYDGWGAQIDASGSATNPWRYRGLLNIGAGWADALLDMGARDYSPQLGQFTQQDSVQGSAANPLTMNRFLYALANPATLIDPDGHNACMEDESGRCVASAEANRQVAENQRKARARSQSATQENAASCTLAKLNCSLAEFDGMSVDARKDWVNGLMAKYGDQLNFRDWFNNILGILRFAKDERLMTSGSWESWVDASILRAITQGLALQLGRLPAEVEIGVGAQQWRDFFAYRSSNPADIQTSKFLWGAAEQVATDYGVTLAETRIPRNERLHTTLITFGNAYRAGVKDSEVAKRLGREIGGNVGFAGGLTIGTATGLACGPAFLICAPVGGAFGGIAGFINGQGAGEDMAVRAIDPRNESGAHDFTWLLYQFYPNG